MYNYELIIIILQVLQPEQLSKIKPIYVSATQQLVMRNFAQINSLYNYDETNGTNPTESSNKFFLGNSSTNHMIEMIVYDIDISEFTISYENGTTLGKYTIVFQIELLE